ncbi:hypothetical protein ACXYTJ_13250 [Gilvimarinus sp. F26214L]|uniref:hypothetical protein n=1 Tax=Gilvimarinus sp. DZF01 TaxID=3461371 RepID=UPI004045CCF1
MTAITPTVVQGPLKPRAAITALLVSVAIAILPLFFISGPQWMSTELGRAVVNLGHIPFFALVTFTVSLRFPLDRPARWLGITAVTLLVSIAVEAIQAQVGRSASGHDVLRNITGCWLTLCWLQRGTGAAWLGRIAVGSILAFEVFLVVGAGLSQHRLNQLLPALANLDTHYDLRSWTPVNSNLELSDPPAGTDGPALKISLNTGTFSGVALTRLPGNWTGYAALRFRLYNPQPRPIAMTVRVHDARHESGPARWQYQDRYNRLVQVMPGWNEFNIDLDEIRGGPASRTLNLEQVREMRLFATALEGEKVIFARDFRLAKKKAPEGLFVISRG